MNSTKLIIHGLVQGVFFRKHTQERARELNIKGTVRNLPDGSVEVVAEGEEQSLAEFIQWCQRGPSRARVEKVEISEVPVSWFRSFEVLK
jgi:acylphosphatase